MRDGYQAGSRSEQLPVLVHQEFAAVIDRHDPERRSFLLGQNLPGNDVGMMLHGGDYDFITRLDMGCAITLGHEVNPFGRSPDKDDLTLFRGVDEPPDLGARLFVGLRGALAERVHAAVYI